VFQIRQQKIPFEVSRMNSQNSHMKYARHTLLCMGIIFPSVLSAQTYRIVDLGETESIPLVPLAIDDQGTILTQQHPLLHCEDCTFELPMGVDGTVISVSDRRALAISDNGQYVAGDGMVQTDIWQDLQALMAQEDTLHILGAGDPHAVNNLGQVVGSKTYETGFFPSQLMHSFIWQEGVMEQIVPPLYPDMDTTEYSNSWAVGINNTGQVIGRYIPVLNLDFGDFGPDRAYLWKDGVSLDLTPLDEHRQNPRGGYAGAYDINDHGLVVGWSSIFESTGMTAAMWDNGSVVSLGTLDPDSFSFAWRINNLGQVVGWSGGTAFLWQEGEMQALDEMLVAEDAAWQIEELIDLNNQGMILARAAISGTQHFVMLEPVTQVEPPQQPGRGRPAHVPGPPEHVPGPPAHAPGPPEHVPGPPAHVPGPPEHAAGTPQRAAAKSDWPAPYNGVTPARRLGLQVNNIGIYHPTDGLIYTCVQIETNGPPRTPNQAERVDIALAIESLDDGIVRVVKSRPFNAANALNENAQTPHCSGVFESTSNRYEDIVQYGARTMRVTFELFDGPGLRLKLLRLGDL
jgi:probable HAF family extracellular repeat protein